MSWTRARHENLKLLLLAAPSQVGTGRNITFEEESYGQACRRDVPDMLRRIEELEEALRDAHTAITGYHPDLQDIASELVAAIYNGREG